MHQDKESLIRKIKRYVWKQSKKRNSFPISHWQALSSNFQESRATVHVAVACEDKVRNWYCPSYPQLVLLSMSPYTMENPFWSVLSPVPAKSSPNLLPTPSLLTFGRDRVGHKALMLCKLPVQQQPEHGCVINTVQPQMQSSAPYGLNEER